MLYPALDIAGVDPEFALAVLDDFSPAAVEEHHDSLTVYFSTIAVRDAARHAIGAAFPGATVEAREVDDEDWARRSQENLQPIAVGEITINPGPARPKDAAHPSPRSQDAGYTLTIIPSMGFGTGHHQTTRLCLAAMQTDDIRPRLAGATVLDVGTGSGILALAARLLGAEHITGIDIDADAVNSALDNLALNAELDGISFEVADLREWLESGPERAQRSADLVTANLTGALLARSADVLTRAVRPGGHLVVSGLLGSEERLVTEAFMERTRLVSITSEDEWMCLVLKKP